MKFNKIKIVLLRKRPTNPVLPVKVPIVFFA